MVSRKRPLVAAFLFVDWITCYAIIAHPMSTTNFFDTVALPRELRNALKLEIAEPDPSGGGGGGGGGGGVRISTVDTTVLESDIGGTIIMGDTGAGNLVLTFPSGLAEAGQSVSVVYLPFGGPPTANTLTLAGVAVGNAVLTAVAWANVKLLMAPATWGSDAPPPTPAYSTVGTWTPAFSSGTTVTPDAQYLYSRQGPAGGTGAAAVGDEIVLRGHFEATVAPEAPLSIIMGDLPVPIDGTYVRGLIVAAWPSEIGAVTLSLSGDDLVISSENASTLGFTINVDFTIFYQAGA